MQSFTTSRRDLRRILNRVAAPICLLTALSGLILQTRLALANGGKTKLVHYEARISLADGGDRACTFDADIDSVLFFLTTSQNKYHVVALRIRNGTRTPLSLSAVKDRAVIEFNTSSVGVVLDLPTADPALWSTFGLEMRRALAYPPRVEAGEEESVYLFIPKEALGPFADARQTPRVIRYTIESRGSKPIELRTLSGAAAKV